MGVRVPPFALMQIFTLFLLLFAAILRADPVPDSPSFVLREARKMRVDTYDFPLNYTQLEKIEIDGRRKKEVELFLTGSFPQLRQVLYEGTFGNLVGKFTGDFPAVDKVSLLTICAHMALDFRGKFTQSCEITVRGSTEDIALILPQDVGVVVHTKTREGLTRLQNSSLKRKGFWTPFNKIFENPLAESCPIVVTFRIETTSGSISLSDR